MGLKLVKPGGTYWGYFATSDGTALVDADVLPEGTVTHNAADDGAVAVTVTHIATGFYGYTFTVPSSGYAAGERVAVRIPYTVGAQFGLYLDAGQVTTASDLFGTGDAFARLGVPAGLSIADDIADLPTPGLTTGQAALLQAAHDRALLALPNAAPGTDGGVATTDDVQVTVTPVSGALAGASTSAASECEQFVLWSGDTLPQFTRQLTDADGAPIVLPDGTTAALYLSGAGAPTLSGAAMTVTPGDADTGTPATVSYTFDTDTPPFRNAQYQVRVTYPSGDVQTYPAMASDGSEQYGMMSAGTRLGD